VRAVPHAPHSGASKVFELARVQRRISHLEAVAATFTDEHLSRRAFGPIGLERLAEMEHVCLDRCGTSRRRAFTPQRVRDTCDRNRRGAVEQQQRQHGPLLRTTQVHG
jgi:hypothetical protein